MVSLSERQWRLLRWAAVPLYLALALLLGIQNPGLNYDEAMHMHGAVQMLHFTAEPPFAHEARTWVESGGRHWQVMVVSYVGAIKVYLLMAPFALFGCHYAIARTLAVLLGGLGIWGAGVLLRREIGESMAAMVCLLLAAQPSYVAEHTFDYSGFSAFTASMGLSAIALARVRERRSAARLLLLGFVLGIAVWARVNTAWLFGSAIAGGLIAFRREMLLPLREWLLIGAGALAGSAPLLYYEVVSHGATLRTVAMAGTPPESFLQRLILLGRAFVADTEMRRVWGGQAVPDWQSMPALGLVLLCTLACLLLRDGAGTHETAWRRATAVTFLLFSALMLTSRLRVNEHHLDGLLPLAAALVVFSARALVRRYGQARILLVAALAVYFGVALVYDVAAARGLAETGGVSRWSNQIPAIAERLQSDYAGRRIKIVDWGLQNNLFVLSEGRIRSSEIFWGSTDERSAAARSWKQDIEPGAVFVLNAPGNEFFPASSRAFRRALADSGLPLKSTPFRQRNGAPLAEIIEVLAKAGAPAGNALAILGLHPAGTSAAAGFNRQPDGNSALAIGCRNATPTTVVVWNGMPLASVATEHLVSALVPAELYAKPGTAAIELLDPATGTRSNAVTFTVK